MWYWYPTAFHDGRLYPPNEKAKTVTSILVNEHLNEMKNEMTNSPHTAEGDHVRERD